MFQVLKPSSLNFNKMCPNVTLMSRWQRKGTLLDIGGGGEMTMSLQLYNIKPKRGVLNPKWRRSVFLYLEEPRLFFKKKGDILTISGRVFSFSKGILQEYMVQQKILPRWDCSSSRPEMFLILFSALLVLHKRAAVVQQWQVKYIHCSSISAFKVAFLNTDSHNGWR